MLDTIDNPVTNSAKKRGRKSLGRAYWQNHMDLWIDILKLKRLPEFDYGIVA